MSQEFRRQIRIGEVDPQPSEYKAELSVSISNSEATINHPARLAVTLLNAAETTRDFSTVFEGSASSSHGDPGIILGYGEGGWPPKCVEMEGNGKTQDALEFAGPDRPVHLSAGERAQEEFYITDDPTVEGCIPRGEYRYESLYAIDPFSNPKNAPTFTWGFELCIL